ncbi:MAG: lamin tail domain-containing protein [Lewinellaceae bacterium]|nr:lamin tail domain-containing protein [Lewinellaceae bacterium]
MNRLNFFLLPLCSILCVVAARAQAPVLSIPTQGGYYIEGVGLCFSVRLTNPSPNPTTVDVMLAPVSTATLGVDFTVDPSTVVFPANFEGDETVCVITTDDAMIEPPEAIVLKLANPSNNATLGTSSTIAFGIYDNDSITTTLPCQRPFFSEYIHALTNGGSRALEIYNPSPTAVNLADYNIRLYYNGDSIAGNVIPLSGTLQPGEVFVAAHNESFADVLALADFTSPFLNFTGDDAVGLYNGDQLIDMIGIPGQDPGFGWPGGNKSTASSVLVRDSIVRQGETKWVISAAHWKGYDQSNYSFLGSHLMLPCDPSGGIPPILSVVTNDAEFDEGIGGLGFLVTLYYPKDVETTVDIVVGSASTATNGVDFDVTPTTLVFPANYTGSQSVVVGITDDMLDEPNETVVLKLRNPSNSGLLLDSVWVLTILDNDPTVGVQSAGNTNTFKVHPNPVRAGSVIYLETMPGARFSLFNSSGKLVYQFTEKDTQAIPGQLVLPATTVPGVYHLRAESSTTTAVARIIVME